MRNTMTLLALAVAATCLLPARAVAQFEGVITIAVHDKQDGNMTLTQWTMGNKYRLDMDQGSKDGDGPGAATMILNHEAKTVTMIMYARQMYMTTPMTAPKTPATGANDDDTGKLTSTGRTETVAGVSCEVYHGVTTEGGKRQEGDICFAKGVGFMPALMSGAGAMGEGMRGLYAKLGAPPGSGIMKVTSDVNGKPQVDMEVTKVERRPLSAADFLPPAGYKPFQAPGQ